MSLKALSFRLKSFMAYSRSKKITDTDRRVQLLRNQLYGKEQSVTFSFTSQKEGQTKPETPKPESSYLRQELTKIFILAILAIGTEVALFIATNQGLIKF